MKCCVPHENISSSQPSIACRTCLPCSIHHRRALTLFTCTTINQTSIDVFFTLRLHLRGSIECVFQSCAGIDIAYNCSRSWFLLHNDVFEIISPFFNMMLGSDTSIDSCPAPLSRNVAAPPFIFQRSLSVPTSWAHVFATSEVNVFLYRFPTLFMQDIASQSDLHQRRSCRAMGVSTLVVYPFDIRTLI